MYINKIEIENFRIYKDFHELNFNPEGEKNVFVISGNNGYGKTTFLTALIWCLYGKHMKDVDDTYKSRINEVGGYAKFLQTCLNRLTYNNKIKSFSISLTFSDVNIPSVPCKNIKIKRTGFFNSGTDELEIIIDGQENELTKEVGNDIFIQDFILPKEIAKFFFFDSEKIVSLAEIKTIEGKRQLSRAYSEVLGIKKYEDLKKNLQDLTIRFKKGSAKPQEEKKFNLLSSEVEIFENNVLDLDIKLDQLNEEKIQYKKIIEDLQEKLIRKGSSLSINEINNLKIEKFKLNKEIEDLKNDFKELLVLAPFAIVGSLFTKVDEQLKNENNSLLKDSNQKELTKKGKQIIRAFKKVKTTQKIKNSVDDFYKEELEKIINKYLLKSGGKKSKDSEVLHNFIEDEYNEFNSLHMQLKTSYSNRVKDVSKSLRDKRLKYSRVSRKLSDAESKESDGVIAKYRVQKTEKENELTSIELEIDSVNQKIGEYKNEITVKRKVISELAKKIKLQVRYVEKDKLAKRLIKELNEFISKMKKEKKASLEKRILKSLKTLMHKQNFIKKVEVVVENDIIDINLYNARKEMINKETLSKGEQQLYATSILKALVEESNIEFPIFIDSPLQKFDSRHAKNIITNFYPQISKQVVLLPLLNKEMTEDEYDALRERVQASYLIVNKNEDQSSFVSVNPSELFEQAKKIQAYVF